jgi:HemK-related putative methylase
MELAGRPLSGRLRTKVVRRLWRGLLWYRFLLFQRHRHNHLVLEKVAGRPVLVLPQVFNPKLFRTGELLAEILDGTLIPPGAKVLDMGTGSGIGAVAAATWAGQVVAVDINPAAVRCARINALLNRVEERIEVLHGDLFAPLGSQRFDVVLFNPPYYRGDPKDALDGAFYSNDIAGRFAAGLRDHLKVGGYALVLLSTDGDASSFLHALDAQGLDLEVVTRRDLINEILTIYRIVKKAGDPC